MKSDTNPAPAFPSLEPTREALRAWADATYGAAGWLAVSIVAEKPGGGSADVIQVKRAG